MSTKTVYDKDAPSPFRWKSTKRVFSNAEWIAFETQWANRPRKVPGWIQDHPSIIGWLVCATGLIMGLHFLSSVPMVPVSQCTIFMPCFPAGSQEFAYAVDLTSVELWLALTVLGVGELSLMTSLGWKLLSLVGFDTRDFMDLIEFTEDARKNLTGRGESE